MRVPMIAGNWKMNTTVSEAVKLVGEMRPLLEPINNVEKVVCPPFVSLTAVREILKGSSVKLGAQNMYFEEKGAYTGEVSSLMLAGLCEYVILGHSERRQYFGETNEIINKKVRTALKAGLKPILCVGESLVQYEDGKTEAVVTDPRTDCYFNPAVKFLKNERVTRSMLLPLREHKSQIARRLTNIRKSAISITERLTNIANQRICVNMCDCFVIVLKQN